MDSCSGNSKYKPIPDGNGEFTQALGMLVDKLNIGFSKRSWSYTMIVNNGEIEKMFIESGKRDNADDDPYGEKTDIAVDI